VNKTFIIAEAGANHDRKFDQALSLIDVAISSGADAVKFQTYSSDTLYTKNTPDFAGYENINKLIEEIQIPREWQSDLKSYCDENGIEFMSTPFDIKAVDELYDLGVKRIKIAGFEATDPRIVRYAASTKLPLIITAGIGTDLSMMQKIIDWVCTENSNPDLTFLHGNNAYPTPLEHSCLLQIRKIIDTEFSMDFNIGISDHTNSIVVPSLAVSLGATVVEKHYTLSRHLRGPDHGLHALEPRELSQMIQYVRDTEKCLLEKNSVSDSEVGFLSAMRSVVAKTKILTGDKLCEKNITTKRPFLVGSIPAKNFYDLFGKTAKTEIEEDSLIFEGDVD
tara:strand:- start:115 stop:1122 length:1008 start_codon:yes stop_codon:yes gene_type:complete